MEKELITKIFKLEEIEMEVKVDLDNNTVWLNINQICKLYNKARSTIKEHITNVINCYENTFSLCRNFRHTGSDNKEYQVKHYSLELILKIGYKIDASKALIFKNWAENTLNELKLENTKRPLPIEVFEDGNFKLEVSISPKEKTIWLTQEQLAKLFGVDRSTISKHINNILDEEELDKSNVQKMHIPFSDKMVYVYNLNMIISVGFRVNSKKATTFRIWANNILENYLMKGYAIDESRATLYKENYLELNKTVLRLENKIENHEERLINIETNKKQEENEKIFYKGALYDAYSFLTNIIKKATKNIILIDNYIDIKTLDILSYKNKKVNIDIITQNNTLTQNAINKFNNQYSNLTIKINNNFHDRFLIIDNKDLYHIGASIKDAGTKGFAINEMNHNTLKELIKVI